MDVQEILKKKQQKSVVHQHRWTFRRLNFSRWKIVFAHALASESRNIAQTKNYTTSFAEVFFFYRLEKSRRRNADVYYKSRMKKTTPGKTYEILVVFLKAQCLYGTLSGVTFNSF